MVLEPDILGQSSQGSSWWRGWSWSSRVSRDLFLSSSLVVHHVHECKRFSWHGKVTPTVNLTVTMRMSIILYLAPAALTVSWSSSKDLRSYCESFCVSFSYNQAPICYRLELSNFPQLLIYNICKWRRKLPTNCLSIICTSSDLFGIGVFLKTMLQILLYCLVVSWCK